MQKCTLGTNNKVILLAKNVIKSLFCCDSHLIAKLMHKLKRLGYVLLKIVGNKWGKKSQQLKQSLISTNGNRQTLEAFVVISKFFYDDVPINGK